LFFSPFFSPFPPYEDDNMSLQATPASDAWYRSVEKTSQTDDERIKDITVLPPPEHLIRFFPIRGTPATGAALQGLAHPVIATCLAKKS
jgi:3-deoxy-7-phosphoheptulonate synthase